VIPYISLFSNSLVLVILAWYIGVQLRKSLQTTTRFENRVFLVCFGALHLLVSFVFGLSLDRLPSILDPHDFFNAALSADSWFQLFDFGHGFLSFFIYPLVHAKVSLIVLFLVFSTISFKGFLIYFEMIKLDSIQKRSYPLLVFFMLPSIHVWTGMLGKEALLFLWMALLLKKISDRTYDWKMIVLFLLIFFLRPHVFFVLLVVLFVLVLRDDKNSRQLKVFVIWTTAFSFLVLLPLGALFFIDLDSFSLNSLLAYKDYFINYTASLGGNTAISLKETTFFSRILYLLFMPLPFLSSIKSPIQWISVVENSYYLVAFIGVFVYLLRKRFSFKMLDREVQFALVSGSFLLLLFASYLYNLGLGNRMRLMFLPYFFFAAFRILDTLNSKQLPTQMEKREYDR
jgi:hypothetical protein